MDDKNVENDKTVRLEKDDAAVDASAESEKTTLLSEASDGATVRDGSAAEPEADKTVERRVSPATAAPAGGSDAAASPASPALRRGRHVAVAACVVLALCAVLAGVGYVGGWFSPDDPMTAVEDERGASEEEPADVPEEDATAEEEPSDESASEDAAEGDDTAADDAAAEDTPTAEGTPAAATDAPAGSAGTSSSGAGAATGSGTGSSSGSGTSSGSSSAPAPSAPSESEPPAPAPEPSTITVHVSIDSSRAASYGYPSSMGSGSVTLKKGATVYDALLAMGVSVSGSSSYIRSIGGLSEFDCGDGSGWMYAVNGSYPSVGCGSYTLSGGESILWVYTVDLGNDL